MAVPTEHKVNDKVNHEHELSLSRNAILVSGCVFILCVFAVLPSFSNILSRAILLKFNRNSNVTS